MMVSCSSKSNTTLILGGFALGILGILPKMGLNMVEVFFESCSVTPPPNTKLSVYICFYKFL